jgi:DNA (cytosine-5)-methyltransferase 1
VRRALDLFCGAGGATRGLQRAGFHVTGVDVFPQPSYVGDRFIEADATALPLTLEELREFDFIWASPPCQRHTQLRGLGKAKASDVDLIPVTRELLRLSGVPYVIENVVGAPLINPVTLCGSMFGLAVKRHRLFEATFPIEPPRCACRGRRNIAVYGKSPAHRLPDGVIRARDLQHGREAMGIDWMNWRELTQAIPPAYSEHIARAARPTPTKEDPRGPVE